MNPISCILLLVTTLCISAQDIQYTCDRQSYKATCDLTGGPSQFTLRWYLKDGKCCSYPYGHCKGDEIATENVLRTKEDCEAICVRGETGGVKTTTWSVGILGNGSVITNPPNPYVPAPASTPIVDPNAYTVTPRPGSPGKTPFVDNNGYTDKVQPPVPSPPPVYPVPTPGPGPAPRPSPGSGPFPGYVATPAPGPGPAPRPSPGSGPYPGYVATPGPVPAPRPSPGPGPAPRPSPGPGPAPGPQYPSGGGGVTGPVLPGGTPSGPSPSTGGGGSTNTTGGGSNPDKMVTLSCDKLPLKETCETTGGGPAQFVLRWYLKDGKCCSYQFGHCKGDEIATEPAIRTKVDCEQVCLNGGSMTGSGGGGSGNGGSGSGDNKPSTQTINYNCNKQPLKETCELSGGPPQYVLRWYLKDGKCCSYQFGHCKGDEIATETALRSKAACDDICMNGGGGGGGGNGGNGGVTTVRPPTAVSCDRQPYKQTCEFTGGPPQFTLRWYLKDGKCCSYPYGHCKGDEIATESAIRTKEACVDECISGKPGSGGSSNNGDGGSPNRGSGTRAPVAATCDRQPYIAICELTGQPSQFTLRWYKKDGKCCSYPYGHCKGDEIATESALRTKKACDELCLNN